MRLLTKPILSQLLPLESTDRMDKKNIKVPCRFYLSGTRWCWHPFEFDGHDTFFGLVKGEVTELGYFTLDQLRQRKGPMGSRVERDKFFSSCRLSELMKCYD